MRTRPGCGQPPARCAVGSSPSRAIALHVFDDNFLQPNAGTSAGDHLVSGRVPLALAAGAVLIGLGIVTLWRSRHVDDRLWIRYARRAAPAWPCSPTDGIEVMPEEYERRVVGFFDETL